MCLSAGADGTKTAPLLRVVAGTGEVISKPARSVALGIRSASDGADRDALVLTVDVDDGISVGEDGARVGAVAVTTRPPVAALVTVNAIPVSFSFVVSSTLFSGLCFRLALRVCRASGVCADDADVCLPFCGDTSRCTSVCTARGAADLLGKSIRLTISASIDFVCNARSSCVFILLCFALLACFFFSEMLDVVVSVVVVSVCSVSYSTLLSDCLL